MIKKFAQAIQVIKVLLAIVPLVRKIIEQVEIPGSGPEKKAAVLAALSNTIDSLPWEVAPEVKDTALKIVGGLIDVILGILNLLGHDWSKTI